MIAALRRAPAATRGWPPAGQLPPAGRFRMAEGAAGQLLLVAALAGAASSGWSRVGEGRGPMVAVALGSIGPPLLALAVSTLRRRTWPAWLAVPGHVGLLGAAAVVVAGGAGPAASAVSGGWARLLSTILPAPSGPDVAVLALIVAGATSAIGSELALRSRAAAIPAIPAVLALVATRMATQGAPEGGLMAAAAAVVLLAGGLALARAGPRRPAAGVPVVLLAAVAAVVVAPSLPFAEARPPFDPRALRHLAPVDAGAVNPLARLRAWQAAPDRVLLRVTLSDPVALRLAVLDRYDGVRFSAEPHYTRAGSVLPPPPPGDPGAGAPTRPVTTDIVVAGLDGPWVPVPDRPTRISGPPVAVDPRTGVMVAPGGIQPGQRYRVVAAIPSGRLARLPGATPAPAKDVGAAATTPPGLPSELADLAAAAAGDPSDPALTRLGRLQELFRAGFSEDPSSPPGHSLARLTAFLGPDDRVGSTEQLATAFAVLARSLGYPTRVGVGFRLSGRGEVEVRGADAQAWPEVALSGAGWVAFDPVPPRGASLGNDRRAPVEEAAAAAAAAEVAAPPTPPPDRPPAPPAGSSGHRSWRRPAGAAVGIALAVLALALAVTVGSKRRRRSARRRAPDAAGRVRGAWAEAADRLVERGVGRPRPRTPRDAAQAVGAVSAAAVAPLSDLGELAERAAFAGPGAVAAPDADRAWADLELLESALAAEESRLGSLRHALDPRPLARQP